MTEPVMVNLRVLSRSAKRVFIRVTPRIHDEYMASGKPLCILNDIYPMIAATVSELFPQMGWRRRMAIMLELTKMIDQLNALEKIPAGATRH